MRIVNYDEVKVFIGETRDEMGSKVAADAIKRIKEELMNKEALNILFAAAPSQNDFFDELVKNKDIDWNRINAFHMDEYIGLGIESENSFSNFLRERVFSHLSLRKAYYINGLEDPNKECERYGKLLEENPIDIVFMGIGENGHIAFNDPDVANFKDPEMVKMIELDDRSRRQQVNDGCFPTIDDVPVKAITLTIPALIRPEYIFCIVPTKLKAEAVKNTLVGPISEKCPASILRTKVGSRLYLDEEAASLLEQNDEGK